MQVYPNRKTTFRFNICATVFELFLFGNHMQKYKSKTYIRFFNAKFRNKNLSIGLGFCTQKTSSSSTGAGYKHVLTYI